MSNKEDSPENQDSQNEGEKKKVIKLGGLPENIEKKIEDKTSSGENKPGEGPSAEGASKLRLSRTEEGDGPAKQEERLSDAAREAAPPPVPSGEEKKPSPPPDTKASPAPSESAHSSEAKPPAQPGGGSAPKPPVPPRMKQSPPRPPGPGGSKPKRPMPPPPPRKAGAGSAQVKAAETAPPAPKEESPKGSAIGLVVDVIAAGVAIVFAYLLYTKY